MPDGYLWGQYDCGMRRTGNGWRIAEMVLLASPSTDATTVNHREYNEADHHRRRHLIADGDGD